MQVIKIVIPNHKFVLSQLAAALLFASHLSFSFPFLRAALLMLLGQTKNERKKIIMCYCNESIRLAAMGSGSWEWAKFSEKQHIVDGPLEWDGMRKQKWL